MYWGGIMQNRIRELRKAHHMSQIHLSIELEVSQETVSAYENGRHYPSFQTLVKLSEIFQTSIDYIMGLSDANGTDLNGKEKALITIYRALNPMAQEKALSYIQGLSDFQ